MRSSIAHFGIALLLTGPFAVGSETLGVADSKGRPQILVFSKGFACQHCSEQYQAFLEVESEFRNRNITIKFIVPDKPDQRPDVGALQSDAISVISDADQALRDKYKDQLHGSDHGVLLLGKEGVISWSHVGSEPFLNARAILALAAATAVAVELQVNSTPEITDDYLTWAPMKSRIRLTHAPEGATAVKVVLTNDLDGPTPAGRAYPLDGSVCFDRSLTPGSTASQKTLELRLPADGCWVDLFIAGQFPRASTKDKDAVVEIHLDTADGALITTAPMMVRVRKNIETLTPEERTAYLKAMHDLHVVKKQYEKFPHVHDLAAQGKIDYQPIKLPDGSPNPKYWPDQAHGGPAFLPWHRAFLLQFERDLQQINPAVTIPFWRQNERSTAFTPFLLGTNRRDIDATFHAETIFSPTNWLYGWSIEYRNLKTLIRAPRDHSLLVGPDGVTPPNGDATFFPRLFGVPGGPFATQEAYDPFEKGLENNPHNRGHYLIGAWHLNCLISPSDPSFWSFHAEDDRLWAMWQYVLGRHDGSGADGVSYNPVGKFVPDLAFDAPALGHYLEDTMWPWDVTKGRVVECTNSRGNRPDIASPYGPFPKAALSGTWPAADAKPTPGDMIDYLGITRSRLPHGVCYADVPYGRLLPAPAPTQPATPGPLFDVLAEVATDNTSPLDRRQKALVELRKASSQLSQKTLLSIASDRESPGPIRERAIDGLLASDPATGADLLLSLLKDDRADISLCRFAVQAAAFIHLSQSVPAKLRQDIHSQLQQLASQNQNVALAADAAIALSAGQHQGRAHSLKLFLETKRQSAISIADVVTAASSTGALDASDATMSDLLKSALSAQDYVTAVVLLRALAGDPATKQLRVETLAFQDPAPFAPVRRAALRSLMHETPEAIDRAIEFLELPFPMLPVTSLLRLESAGVIRVTVEKFAPLSATQITTWKARVITVLAAVPNTPERKELRDALQMALDALDRSGR